MSNLAFLGLAASIQYTIEASNALTAAQAGPTYTLYRNGTVVDTTSGSPEVTLTTSNPATGIYRVSFSIPGGWAANDVVELLAATGTTGSGFVGRWMVLAGPPTTAALIASAVRSELATELARIDAAITTRLASASYTAPSTPPTSAAIAAQVRAELAVELARIDAAITSRLASASYTAPPSVAGLATSAEVDALSDEIAAVPTTSEIAAALLITPANKLLTDGTGQVTATNGGSGSVDLSEVEERLTSIEESLGTLTTSGVPSPSLADPTKLVYSLGQTTSKTVTLATSYTGAVTVTWETLDGVNLEQQTSNPAAGSTYTLNNGADVTANPLLGRWSVRRTDNKYALAEGIFEVRQIAS